MAEKASEAGAPPQTPLTDEQLRELEGALRAATPAPWDAGTGHSGRIFGPSGEIAFWDGNSDEIDWAADAVAAVLARNAAPCLIAEVHRLRARVAELYEALLALFEQFENFEYTTGTEAIQRARAALAKAEDRPIEVTNRPPEK
jgi:hypothetical protein